MSNNIAEKNTDYRVLARKYRPHDFTTLIGQDALVRTLTNALDTGRIAHGFMLTGIRGVGKTTTARILARALNYGDRKTDSPTAHLTEMTDQCRQIIEGRHVDVIEMDAASNNSVDDIRDIIDGVRYAPTSARYKVYIIDEVHMLSGAAFNALLKTLEEPPPHVKFIFATTEIRKVPVTVLSRCQRFDLRRVDLETLMAHFKNIAEQENVAIDDDALRMIARAADGSVRDGLSLLDQAISISAADGSKNVEITAEKVRAMLGLADRSAIIDLFSNLMHGNAKETIEHAEQLYNAGAEPLAIAHDLLELTHLASKEKSAMDSLTRAGLADHEQEIMRQLSTKLSVAALTITWQVLLKGINEIQNAPVPQNALEMVLIRLLYITELPNPDDLLKIAKDNSDHQTTPPIQSSPPSQPELQGGNNTINQQQANTAPNPSGEQSLYLVKQSNHGQKTAAAAASPLTVSDVEADIVENPQDFRSFVNLFKQNGEHILYTNLYKFARVGSFSDGKIEIIAEISSLHGTGRKLAQLASGWTGQTWQVDVIPANLAETTEPSQTLSEQDELKKQALLNEVLKEDMIVKIQGSFPKAQLIDVVTNVVTIQETEAQKKLSQE